MAPRIDGLLETALYVEDLGRSVAFFRDVFGLRVMAQDGRMAAFDAGRQGVLLLFKRGASVRDMHFPIGTIPGHDGAGPLHMAFAISAETYEPWLAHFAAAGVPIAGEVRWPRGGRSAYVRDPDGHLLEIATPGLWETY